MAPDRIEQELQKMRKTLSWHIAVSLSIVILIVGGWSRAEIRISNNKEDIEQVRKAAVNIEAFHNVIDTYRAVGESYTKLIDDPDIRKVADEFNRKTDEIINRIIMSETEIILRNVKK